ncbi:hypothetical protein A2242_04680 [Candidatus Falkowbacteria bacterium RIFOXYA2_FULL_47_9]|uniref:Type II secretion system protein GspF domain-containing protein n=1 Tax=Candidatus Falkowbacteria bacterium RIFOXYA2_FULL_47_9 TaxID=1797995 RepID=A0A1F5SPG6_9BACT|nr:MAG: hypothetical protein A2242_04680 [Candidatus Falkowbacteria bacterium RIFOXYA2_FULL_47_9]
MALFQYKAKDSADAIHSGMVDAASEQLAQSTLLDQGLMVISLKRRKPAGFANAVLNRVKTKDVVIFSRQFSVMVSASIPIVQALKVLIDQTQNVTLKLIISEIADEVNGGAKLSDALGKRKNIFDQFYVSVVRAGETSGKLDEVLNYLADEMEKDYDMTHKIRGAMIYPAFVLTGLGIVGTVMLVWVIPKLTAMISESGGELPLSTRIVIAVSSFMQAYWWLLLIAVIGAVVFFRFYVSLPSGRRQVDFLKLKLPIFGPLLQKIALVRFTRSLKTLISGGVAISSSLHIAADVVGNAIYQDLIEKTKKEIEGGNSISSVFAQSAQVPAMVSQMLAIGEKTGKLDLILEKITNFYTREIENMTANLVTLMEPLIMVIMGVGVGIMVAAIIMPMYNMANQF